WAHNFEVPRVGDAALIARLETPGVLNNGKKLTYACGLSLGEFRGLNTVGHSGGDAGYRSQITMFRGEKFAGIVLSNLANAQPGRRARGVAEMFWEDRLSKPAKAADPPAGPRPKFEALPPDRLRQFTGDYYSEELGTTYSLIVREGGLVATHRRHQDVPL